MPISATDQIETTVVVSDQIEEDVEASDER